MLGRIFSQKNDMRFLRERLNVRGIRKASATDVALHNFFEVLLKEADVALGHLDHAGAVGIATAHGGSKIREARRNHCAQVPGTVDPNVHRERPPKGRGWHLQRCQFVTARRASTTPCSPSLAKLGNARRDNFRTSPGHVLPAMVWYSTRKSSEYQCFAGMRIF